VMSEDKYDNYTDDDFLADLNAYADQRDAEQAEDNAELKQHLGEMVGGFLGVWWYLRAFSATASRNIRTYAAVADKQAKLTAWKTADEQIEQEHPHYQSKVTIMNEFGACSKCLPYLGNDYTLAEAKSLVPFHYNCRCTIVRDTSDFDSVIAGVTTAVAQSEQSKQDAADESRVADMIEIGDLSPLTTVQDYQQMRENLNDSLIGLKTVDQREVKEFSNHFIDRTLGGGWQNKQSDPWKGRRSGVKIEDIIYTLTNGRTKIDYFNKNQVQYISDYAQITFNIETGRLVQVNPRKGGE